MKKYHSLLTALLLMAGVVPTQWHGLLYKSTEYALVVYIHHEQDMEKADEWNRVEAECDPESHKYSALFSWEQFKTIDFEHLRPEEVEIIRSLIPNAPPSSK